MHRQLNFWCLCWSDSGVWSNLAELPTLVQASTSCCRKSGFTILQ